MTNAQTILIVEDEPEIQAFISLSLNTAGFKTVSAGDGQEGFSQAVDHSPDLILLDWMMPKVNGLELLRRLRRDQRTEEVPVIMLSAKSEIDNKSQGLDSGADDYLCKPFSPKELISRINALLRRTSKRQELSAKNLKLDTEGHVLTIDNKKVEISPTEFKLLTYFLTHQERTLSREQILNGVWGSNKYVDDRTVDVHVKRLRKAIAISNHEKMIQTVRGIGYRFSTKD